MMLGARLAMCGGGVPTARDYVQGGIVLNFSAKENAGYGNHDDYLNGWMNLANNTMMMPQRSAIFSWSKDLFTFDCVTNRSYFETNTQMNTTNVTFELGLSVSRVYTAAGRLILVKGNSPYLLNFWVNPSTHTLGTDYISSGYTLSTDVYENTFYKVVIRYHTNRIVTEVNGDTSIVNTSTATSKTYSCIFGNTADYQRPIAGSVKWIRAYNRILTDEDVLKNSQIDHCIYGI